MNPNPNGLNPEALDDFYAECDEYLRTIGEELVKLEQWAGQTPDREVVATIFRCFHSFKGNAAIVGLRPAEALAHATEDILRELMRGKTVLDDRKLQLLASSTRMLEQVVVAFRDEAPIPEHGKLLRELSANVSSDQDAAPTRAASGSGSQGAPQIEAARAAGLVLFKFEFTPSPELDARGTNINSFRAKLAALGEVLQVTPQVRGKGMVVFELIAGLHEVPGDLAAWEKDGITAELIEAVKAPESAAALAGGEGASVAPSHVVRVDLKRLDELMRITGELIIQRSRFEQHLTRVNDRAAIDGTLLQEINSSFARSLRELREGIMRVRMVPVAEIFSRMPFVVRDLARETKKQVRLKLEGQQTEIDKYLIERLKDPLLHMVRNSFAHGIEPPEERTANGKPGEALISLKASTAGDSVIIQVADDGRGINAKEVAARARSLGLPVPAVMDDAALLEILCAPGFSTRNDADRAAGRGVGMAVVSNVIRELGGVLTLKTEQRAGTAFTLRLPLTLAVADAFVVSDAQQTCAVPQGFVSEVLEVKDDEIRVVNRTEVIQYRSGILPIKRLSALFNLDTPKRARSCALVLSSERGSIGLVVERVHGQREVVVNSISDPLVRVKGISGATELGDGKPVLILDVPALTSGAVRPLATNEREQQLAAAI